MRKKGKSQLLSTLSLFFILLSLGVILLSLLKEPQLTGYAIYDPAALNLSFVPPTPSSGATANGSILLNLTSAVPLTLAWVQWNGVNETMIGSGTTWILEKAGAGTITYRAYGNITPNGTYSSTEERTITFQPQTAPLVVSINLSIPNQTLSEDAAFSSLDLWNFTQTNIQHSNITYTRTQTNTSLIDCAISSNRYFNCTLASNTYGTASLSITASSQNVSLTQYLSFIIQSVNDPPLLTRAIPNQTLSFNQSATLTLSEYYTDIENNNLTYNATQPGGVTIALNGSKATLTSTLQETTQRNLSFSAYDGTNSTPSNQVYLNLTFTIQPAILEPTRESFTIPNQQWKRNHAHTLDLTLYLRGIPANATFSATGSQTVVITFNESTAILTPPQGWTGTDSVVFTVTSPTLIAHSNNVTLTVVHQNQAPTLQQALPNLTFDENQTSITIDLNSHFQDPDGDTLRYTVGEAVSVNTSFHTQSQVVFSLATTDIASETVKITATDPSGEAVTDEILITIADSLRQDNFPYILLLTLFVVGVVGSLLFVVIKKRNSLLPQKDTPLYKQPKPQEPFTKRLFSFILPEKKSGGLYKKEVTYLNETIGLLGTLIEHTEDNVSKNALKKERDRLTKTFKLLKGDPDNETLRTELLTLKETKASLNEVREDSADPVVKEELAKGVDLLTKIVKNIS